MQRVFVKNIGKYRVGDIRDWGPATWSQFQGYQESTVPLQEVLKEGLKVILRRTDKPSTAGKALSH